MGEECPGEEPEGRGHSSRQASSGLAASSGSREIVACRLLQSMSVRTWIKAGVVLVAVVCALAPLSPSLVERWYSTGMYPRVQHVVTPISNLIPFALFDVLTIGAAVVVIGALVRSVRRA